MLLMVFRMLLETMHSAEKLYSLISSISAICRHAAEHFQGQARQRGLPHSSPARAEHHNYHIKICIINKDLLRQILVLMKSPHTFLVLGAIRFLRYKRRHNLLVVAVLELFKFVKSMYTYFVEYFDSRRSRRSKTRTTISRSGSRRRKRASVPWTVFPRSCAVGRPATRRGGDCNRNI
uniref:Serine/threonine-protein phosphatase 4 regulatory subunit 3 n=1 Tax=Culex pipiens TaxID=7175 RepID=A0A8D8AZD0_CULPI